MYYLLLFILYPISILPFRVLYVLSDVAYAFLYYIMRYRKAVVTDNLRNAFPNKTLEELKLIEKKFYRSFCDQWLETVKLLSISEHSLNKHITGNWEVFDDLYKDGKNCYAILGHTFNWEWANVVCQYNCEQQFIGVYMPQHSKSFDRLLQHIRTRSGAWQISMKAKKAFVRLNDVQHIVGLIADQNPTNIKHAYRHTFMNREVPFFKGPEQLATRAKAAVVFAGIKKVKRGYYEIHLQKFCDDASLLQSGDVMSAYVQFMEQQLHAQPENWMWTHKRWKHAKEQ